MPDAKLAVLIDADNVPAHRKKLTLSLNGLSPGRYLLRYGVAPDQLRAE